MAWSAAIGAAGALLGSMFGSNKQESNVQQQIEAAKEENQKNREWNLNLAKMQNSWNIDQWNRENAYNTPAAQMARLKQANINPDLFYGNSGAVSPAAASPEMTSGAASQPADTSGYANLPNYARESVMQAAQIASTLADVKLKRQRAKKESQETDLLSKENFWKNIKEQQNFELTSANIANVWAKTDLTDKQGDKVLAEINEINTNAASLVQGIRESQARIGVLDEQKKTIIFDRLWKQILNSKELDFKDSQIRLNDAQVFKTTEEAKVVYMLAIAKANNMNMDTYLKQHKIVLTDAQKEMTEDLSKMYNAQTGKITVDAELLRKYGSAKVISEIVRNYGMTAGYVADSVGGLVTGQLSKLAKNFFKKSQKDHPSWHQPADSFF